MLTEFAQTFRRELPLLEKPEHRRPSIMARKVVCRPRKPRRTRPILHPPARCLRQIRKLTEPSGEHGPERRVRRKPQKRIPRPQLTVLIAPPHHVRLLHPSPP